MLAESADRPPAPGEPDPVRQVLLVGADSFLDAATIEHYLAENRLLCPDNADGFIPGESAAALLIRLGSARDEGVHITGLGLAREAAQPDGQIPNRATGLTQAIRAALAQARCTPNRLAFRMSDQNGEQFFIREAANAVTRIMLDAVSAGQPGTGLPVHHIADCVGETGAAAGPLALAYLAELMPIAGEVGDIGLMHLANDDGARTALVVEYRY